jgi:nucleoside-diphosphate-sugar epimerase
MVIGNGLIASAFKNYEKYDDIIIFASGVSNSHETYSAAFLREKILLERTLRKNKDRLIVYFSSAGMFDETKNLYLMHKYAMEHIIMDSGNHYIILRLPQVIGDGGNPNTLVNFIVNKIKKDEIIDVYENAYRSIVDVEHIERIIYTLHTIEHNYGRYNLHQIERIRVADLVNLIGIQLGIVPKINYIPSQIDIELKNSIIFTPLLKYLKIKDKSYTQMTIQKYVK